MAHSKIEAGIRKRTWQNLPPSMAGTNTAWNFALGPEIGVLKVLVFVWVRFATGFLNRTSQMIVENMNEQRPILQPRPSRVLTVVTFLKA